MGRQETPGVWSIRYAHLLLTEFFLQIGLSVTRPIVSLYALELGSTVGVAGALSGMLAIAALVARPISGSLSDRFGKPSLLVLSCLLFDFSAVGIVLTGNLIALGVLLFVQGLAFAMKSTVVIALVAELIPEEKIGAGVGWMSLAYTASQAVGPLIGSAVGWQFGYSEVFNLSVCFLSVGLLLALMFQFTGRSTKLNSKNNGFWHRHNGVREPAKNATRSFLYASALPLSLVAGLLMVSQGTLAGFVLFVGNERGISGASLYFLCYALANFLSRPIAGRMSDRRSASFVVKPMLLVSIAAVLCLALTYNALGVLLGGLLMGVGQGSAYSVLQSESVRGVPSDKSGRAANTFYIGPDIGMGLGPAIIGLIIQSFGVTVGLLVCASLTAVSYLVFSRYWASSHANAR